MESKAGFVGIVFFIVFVLISCAKQDDFSVLSGPYLGRTTPGDIPEIFQRYVSPDIRISFVLTFSNNGDLLFFDGTSSTIKGIFLMEQENNLWQEPLLVLSQSQYEDRHFFLTYDSEKIYFTSDRPVRTDAEKPVHPNIWFMGKTNTGWSVPRPLGYPVNTGNAEYYSTSTRNGDIYFTRSIPEDKIADIFRSESVNGKFITAENLGKPINTEYWDADPFIAPDGSYIIYCSYMQGGLGQHDFYISYKTPGGSWTNPKSLGDRINSTDNDVCPYVTSDGNFFFYISNRTGRFETYWVSSKFIGRLKPEDLK